MGLIYHYTNASALLGMFKNCSKENPYITMWATHALYLNDPTEYEYGKEKCRDILPILEENMEIPIQNRISIMLDDDYVKEMSNVRDFLSSTRPKSIHSGTPYVISFSKAEDSLPMWSNYAQNGNGIAIEFDRDKLSQYVVLKDCIYSIEDIDYLELQEDIQEDYNNAILEVEQASGILDKHLAVLNFLTNFNAKVAAFIKHDGYKYEQEVRCRVPSATDILFRESKGLIIPYVEFQIPCDAIRSIYIGPTIDKQRIINSLYMMWHKYKINGVHIRVSNIPYRD